MTQLGFAECAGAPRDLGFDQGRALRDEIRADLRAIGCEAPSGPLARLLGGATPGYDAAFARDLARHFPHLDERVAGLAGAVGCRHEALAALAARELATGVATRVCFDAATRRLELVFADVLAPTGLAVRRVRADGGYASLSVARPGLVFAIAGVNEHGLAGAAHLEAMPGASERWRAPGVLLLEQCIERLDAVEKALEWCERRPGGGRVRLVFADAEGRAAAIAIDGEKRARIEAPADAAAGAAGPRLRVDPAARAIEIEGGGVAAARFELGSLA